MLIALCKCHPKFTRDRAKTGTSAGEGEGREYEYIEHVAEPYLEPTIIEQVPEVTGGRNTIDTVEPPNKGHFGTSHFVLCREVVLFSEVKNVLVQWEGCPEMCPL